MSGGMDIGTILNLHSLFLRRNESPELFLYVVLGNDEIFPDPGLDRTVLGVVTRRVGGEPHTTELSIPSLKTGETVLFAFVKPIIASGSEETRVTEPLPLGNNAERRVQTKGVISCRSLTEIAGHN